MDCFLEFSIYHTNFVTFLFPSLMSQTLHAHMIPLDLYDIFFATVELIFIKTTMQLLFYMLCVIYWNNYHKTIKKLRFFASSCCKCKGKIYVIFLRVKIHFFFTWFILLSNNAYLIALIFYMWSQCVNPGPHPFTLSGHPSTIWSVM